MHKEDGKWRINVVNALWDYKNVVQPAVNPDEEDIKAVITKQRESFIEADLEAYSTCFVHEPYLTWTVTNGGDPGDGLTVRGWDSLRVATSKLFKNRTPERTKALKKSVVTCDKWNIQIRGNTAYISYNQHAESAEQKMDSTETRVLEKTNGIWKVAMQATVADFKDATPPIRSKY